MIGIFVNPRAGKGKALKMAAYIEQELWRRNILFTVHKGEWPSDLHTYKEAWIIGGDGTLNYFLNCYKDIQIPMAIFKGGTGNDFAWQLYGDQSLDDQVSTVLSASARAVDAANCNDKIFVNSVGIGFDGEVLKSMGMIRYLGGHLGYLLVVIRKIMRFREFCFKIRAYNQEYEEKFLLLNIANASRTGGGFKVSPEAVVNDHKLNLLLCRPLNLLGRLRYLPVIEKGRHLKLPFIHHSLVEKISIECEKNLYAQMDGELIQSNRFEIRILPGYLLFKY